MSENTQQEQPTLSYNQMGNRRQRRRIERITGLSRRKQNATLDKKMEILRRTSEVGKGIHQNNLEAERVRWEAERATKDEERIQYRIDVLGMSAEEALEDYRKNHNPNLVKEEAHTH